MKTFILITLIALTSCKDNDSYNIRDNRVNKYVDYINPLDSELNNLLHQVGGRESFILPKSDEYYKIPQDENNPLNKDKVNLGKNLFHETAIALSSNIEEFKQTYSCASCHHANSGFSSGNLQGIGEGGIGHGSNRDRHPNLEDAELDIQPVKTPTILNSAYQKNTLWNGQFGAKGHNIGTENSWTSGTLKEKNHLGFDGVETQAIAGLEAHGMINEDSVLNNSWIKNNQEYINLFKKAYPNDQSNQEITKKSIGLAIAAYERTVLASEAPFQKYLNGDYRAMTSGQKRGALIFFGKASCVRCHNGPSLSDGNFYALGFNDMDENPSSIIIDENFVEKKGRKSFTNQDEDIFKFKTPTLYNLKDHLSYGHGGTFGSINDVIEYKVDATIENIMVSSDNISLFFYPLNLSSAEVYDLSDFITNALYDNNLKRYEPVRTISNLPFPNNESGQTKE